MTLEEKKKLQIGDLIKLKSGSPNLVVYNKEGQWIDCVFWDEHQNKISMTGNFDYALFEIVQSGPSIS